MTEAQQPQTTGLRDRAPRRSPGEPCWVSLMVHDIAGIQHFYESLFGWEFAPGPEQLGPYVRALVGGHDVAGIGQLPPDRHLPVAWTPYLATEDTNRTAETIRLCGGTVGVGPLDAGEAGRLALASDTAGAVFGIWQPAEGLGTAVSGVAGAPAWNELLTRETESVVKFYQAVFGYEVEAEVSADFDYLTLHVGSRPVASLHGVGQSLPRDRGAHWMTFFEVDEPDEAAALAADLGGQILQPPRDAAHGRVVTIADPEGAAFTLIRSAHRRPRTAL
ncbi:VOC family protein [Streptomyces physcomitrii]|uniref:VOC family protein n=1 Tax=Streptomyces physcomitrii TaxID=2724184 RepID=A0ABX1H6F5_9ACTN|nr:VOC family protein [Streptomyces physcomitrii]NKI42824.1 VOC family protein [Streptomyces physcomitrii]